MAEMRGRGNAATLAQAGLPGAARPCPRPGDTRPTFAAGWTARWATGRKKKWASGARTSSAFPGPIGRSPPFVEGDVLYVANHFQVAAYNLTNGQRMWQSQPPPGAIQRSQDWALIAMQPLVTGNRIFARHVVLGTTRCWFAWRKSSGKLLWSVEAHRREFFVSDPVIVQGQLGAVSVGVQLEQQGVLRWNTLDPETGELQSQRDLVRLRNTWGKRACCELVPLEDSRGRGARRRDAGASIRRARSAGSASTSRPDRRRPAVGAPAISTGRSSPAGGCTSPSRACGPSIASIRRPAASTGASYCPK